MNNHVLQAGNIVVVRALRVSAGHHKVDRGASKQIDEHIRVNDSKFWIDNRYCFRCSFLILSFISIHSTYFWYMTDKGLLSLNNDVDVGERYILR